MYNDSINNLLLSIGVSEGEALLHEALSSHGIPIPSNIKSSGYTRWGHKARYWCKPVPNGYRFGDHVQNSSHSVFFGKTPQTDRSHGIYSAEENKESQYEKAASKALAIWKRGDYAGDHPYMLKKQIQYCMLKTDSYGRLMIPIFYFGNNIVNLQYIDAERNKRFMSGGRVVGCYHPIGTLNNNRIILCEGIATAYSSWRAAKELAICCFGSKNLMPVAERFRLGYPYAEIIIGADNDQFEEERSGRNPGLKTAKEVAVAINAAVAHPIFQDLTDNPTDFNDLHLKEGLEEVRRQIEAAYRGGVHA